MNFKQITLFLSFMLCLSVSLPAVAQKSRSKEHRAQQLSEEQQRKYNYYYLEAFRLKEQQKYTESFDMLRHCLAINPKASSAHYEIAQYYLYLKQLCNSPVWL